MATISPTPTVGLPYLSARLTTPAGDPIPGQQILFWVDPNPSGGFCPATTDSTGRATCANIGLTEDALIAGGYRAGFDRADPYEGSEDQGGLLTVE